MNESVFNITKLSETDLKSLGVNQTRVSLGVADEDLQDLLTEADVNELTQLGRGPLYSVEWTGNSNVPRGAVVGGHTIGFLKSGVVSAPNGDRIGTYRRLEEFGGPNKNKQRIVVSMFES